MGLVALVLRRCSGVDTHLEPLLVLVFKLHNSVDQGKQRVVATPAHVVAWVPLGPTLPDENVAGTDLLATVVLHTQELGFGIASVSARADTLFMSHPMPSRS